MTDIASAMKELAEKLHAPRPSATLNAKQLRHAGAASHYPPTITPYLPHDAEQIALAHQRTGHPAFVKAYESALNELVCPNCQGVGFVVLTLASAGPIKAPSPSGVITWFDGNEMYGKGWYIVDRSLQFSCPKCNGK